MKKSLAIVHLYPDLLKTYGDRGNVITLSNRAAWRGVDVSVIEVGVGDPIPPEADLVFIGGGSDRIQGSIAKDMTARKAELSAALDQGATILAVCGGYQLLGSSYETAAGTMLDGLGLLDVTTRAGSGRLVGDVIARCSEEMGGHELVGFENHGGRTFLGPKAAPLASVVTGQGNNAQDGSEGASQGRIVGTYLHGPLLALNPSFADEILAMALGDDNDDDLVSLDDEIEDAAHDFKAGRDHARASSTRSKLTTIVPALVAGGLIFPFLTRSSLWVDEVDSVAAAQRTLGQLIHLLSHRDVVLGAYYFLLHAWLKIAGDSVAWVRLPSAVAAIASILMTVHLGKRIGGNSTGMLAGLLLAVNPQFLFFARDARPYAVVVALALATTLLFLDERKSTRRTVAYTGLAMLGVLLHLFFALVVFSHGLVALKRKQWRGWTIPWALLGIATVALGYLATRQSFEISWITRATSLTYLSWWSRSAGGVLLGVGSAALVAAATRVWLGDRDRDGAVVLAWLFVPALTLITISLVKPVFDGRYVSESLPALAIAVAFGAVMSYRWAKAHRGVLRPLPARIAPAALTASVALMLALGLFTGLGVQRALFDYENLRAGSESLLDGARPADAVVYLPSTIRTALSYYIRRAGMRDRRPVDPTLTPGGSPAATGSFGGAEIPVTRLARTLEAYRRVWVVSYAGTYSPDPKPAPRPGESPFTLTARTVLARDFTTVRDTEYGNLVISLMKRKSGRATTA